MLPHLERLAVLEVEVKNLKETVEKLPTRPELDAFNKALTAVADTQKSIMENQKEFQDLVSKGKTVAVVFLLLGAMASKIIDWCVTFWPIKSGLTGH